MAIILHNLIIDVKGYKSGAIFASYHTEAKERKDRGEQDMPPEAAEEDTAEEAGEHKCKHLIAELLANYQK